MKSTLKIILIGFISGLAGAYVFFHYSRPEGALTPDQQPYSMVGYDSPAIDNSNRFHNELKAVPTMDVDFTAAATKTIPSVVFINSISKGTISNWDWFFGGGSSQSRVSTGSGVIFSSDGYIVTNNHVVESAEKIEVVYNKIVYPAELIGNDPSTDLAVLKIKETNLPAIKLGSSQNLQVGEWVVAVGNPFSLSSTVTSGIVSAKGRRIGILEDKFPIESFIQTDAAINPGNSGGALVNKNGELVGINTAILSQTGSYTGYAFAIPVDITKK
ncbi:MAG: trypsin-like serine protease [Flammeovirgaceae bacterium]|nr:trypsin-like serine protease [Flammeovirgaceae bacterium]